MLIDRIRRAVASLALPRLPKGESALDSSVSAPGIRPVPTPGGFVEATFSNAAGRRAYRIYVPKNVAADRMPLLVMLHGCNQTPENFAIGTRMNAHADEHGFLVVYPAQTSRANPLNCWNWFAGKDQARGRGEPSLIAGITQEVASTYGADEARMFIAGMSAGGAMAVILGTTYPELFAGVGVHSGLPFAAAHDATSAWAAMRGSSPWSPLRDSQAQPGMPTIVFHGDQDRAVAVSNGSQIVEQAVAHAENAFGPLKKTVEESRSADGRTYTHTLFLSADGRPRVEYWLLHGAGHAWSGGSSKGSFTDENGPDASTEMVRFFFAQGSHSQGNPASQISEPV